MVDISIRSSRYRSGYCSTAHPSHWYIGSLRLAHGATRVLHDAARMGMSQSTYYPKNKFKRDLEESCQGNSKSSCCEKVVYFLFLELKIIDSNLKPGPGPITRSDTQPVAATIILRENFQTDISTVLIVDAARLDIDWFYRLGDFLDRDLLNVSGSLRQPQRGEKQYDWLGCTEGIVILRLTFMTSNGQPDGFTGQKKNSGWCLVISNVVPTNCVHILSTRIMIGFYLGGVLNRSGYPLCR